MPHTDHEEELNLPVSNQLEDEQIQEVAESSSGKYHCYSFFYSVSPQNVTAHRNGRLAPENDCVIF